MLQDHVIKESRFQRSRMLHILIQIMKQLVMDMRNYILKKFSKQMSIWRLELFLCVRQVQKLMRIGYLFQDRLIKNPRELLIAENFRSQSIPGLYDKKNTDYRAFICRILKVLLVKILLFS